MTNQEVKERLECNYPDACDDKLRKAYDMAILSLNKQIPKKVIYDEQDKGVKCPNCKRIVYRLETKEPYSYWSVFNDAYCRHCGQALDWSEGETEDLSNQKAYEDYLDEREFEERLGEI